MKYHLKYTHLDIFRFKLENKKKERASKTQGRLCWEIKVFNRSIRNLKRHFEHVWWMHFHIKKYLLALLFQLWFLSLLHSYSIFFFFFFCFSSYIVTLSDSYIIFDVISTFGNLESTTEWLEVVFNIIVLTSGLLLVTMLIGNIKVKTFN